MSMSIFADFPNNWSWGWPANRLGASAYDAAFQQTYWKATVQWDQQFGG